MGKPGPRLRLPEASGLGLSLLPSALRGVGGAYLGHNTREGLTLELCTIYPQPIYTWGFFFAVIRVSFPGMESDKNQTLQQSRDAQEMRDKARTRLHRSIGGRVVDLFAVKSSAVNPAAENEPAAEVVFRGSCGTCANGRRFEMRDGAAFPIAWPAAVTPPGVGDWVQCQVKREPWKYHSEEAPCNLDPVRYEPR